MRREEDRFKLCLPNDIVVLNMICGRAYAECHTRFVPSTEYKSPFPLQSLPMDHLSSQYLQVLQKMVQLPLTATAHSGQLHASCQCCVKQRDVSELLYGFEEALERYWPQHNEGNIKKVEAVL